MRYYSAVLLAAMAAVHLQAQHDMSNMPGMPGMKTVSAENAAPEEASGTSVNPASSPMNMVHFTAETWKFMLHGVVFVTDIQQTGPRGADKLASVNYFRCGRC
jgi:hypothetical protein